jgi:hypothetical protein
MSIPILRFGLFVAAAGILVASSAWSQSIGGGGGRAPTGSNLTSGVGFGNSGFGSNSMGSTGAGIGMGQGGFGQGGLGQGGLGQSGFGSTGFGGQGGFGQSEFIGRDSADVASMFESMSRQGQQFMNRVERSMNRSRSTDSGGERTQQQVRVQLKVGFDYPNPAGSPMSTAFTERLGRVLAGREITGLSLERDGGAVVVEGVASNEFERLVVEQLISQQPGVTSVTSRMTVAEPIAAPTLPE